MAASEPGTGEPEALTLEARDGYPLAARRYGVEGHTRGQIVVAGATGVPQRFYRRFAIHAAHAGFETTTFDYRGIGLSKRGPLEAQPATFLDWGSKDLAAVIDAVTDSTPAADKPTFLMAHSFGGHAIGMTDNHDRLGAAAVLTCGAGWTGWDPPAERVRLWAMWNVVFPPLVALKGYMPMSMMKMGEDLPLGVYRQWKHWCQFPHYFLDDPAAAELKQRCAEVRTPLLAIASTDDRWAPPRSRDAFLLHAYPAAAIACEDLEPAHYGGEMGHMGYFRAPASPLWDRCLSWFEDPRASAPEPPQVSGQPAAL